MPDLVALEGISDVAPLESHSGSIINEGKER